MKFRSLDARSGAFAAVVLAAAAVAWGARWMDEGAWFDRPHPIDAAWQRFDAQRALGAWREQGVGAFAEALLRKGDAYHPPLLPMVAAIVARVAGDDVRPFHCWIAVQFFVVLFVLGAYRLARRALSPGRALFACALAATAPVVATNFRPFFTQLPMAASILWAWDALARADGFSKTRPSIAFGFWAGVAMFTKMLAPVYLVGGVVAETVVALRRGAAGRPAARATAAAATCLLVCGAWYARHWRRVFTYAGDATLPEGQRALSRGLGHFDVERWTYYPHALVDHGLGLPLSIVIVALVVLLFVARGDAAPEVKGRLSSLRPVWWSAAAAYPIVSLGQVNASAFYLIAFVPLFAILGVVCVRSRGKAALVALTAAGAFNVYCAARPTPRDETIFAVGPFACGGKADRIFGGFAKESGVDPTRDRETWPNEEIAREIVLGRGVETPGVGETAANSYCGGYALRFEFERIGLSYGGWNPSLDAVERADWSREIEALKGSEFLLVHRTTALRFAPTVEQAAASVRAAGLEFDVVLDRQVTPDYGAVLFALRKPKRLRGCVTEATAAAREGFVATDAPLAAGWRLVGRATELAPDGVALWTLFFDHASAASDAEATLRIDAADRSRAESTLGLYRPRFPAGDRRLFAAAFECPAKFTATRVKSVRLTVTPKPASGATDVETGSRGVDAETVLLAAPESRPR